MNISLLSLNFIIIATLKQRYNMSNKLNFELNIQFI